MPDSLVITPRPIYKEDIQFTTDPNAPQVTEQVLGVGSVPLSPVDAVLFSWFGQYASDAAAASGGVGIGTVYYNTAIHSLKARMS